MSRLLLNASLAENLLTVSDAVEIVDNEGRVLGVYTRFPTRPAAWLRLSILRRRDGAPPSGDDGPVARRNHSGSETEVW
jgi:hypothetical protein